MKDYSKIANARRLATPSGNNAQTSLYKYISLQKLCLILLRAVKAGPLVLC